MDEENIVGVRGGQRREEYERWRSEKGSERGKKELDHVRHMR